MTVRNLFFNTPARRKFLRTPTTEQGHCVDAVEHLAVAHPAVGFTLACDGRMVLDLARGQSPRERVLAVLGRELADQMLEVNADTFDDARGVALWGMVGLPSLARATGKSQHVFVNGRLIRDKTVQHALREAYRGLIEPSRYPTAVVMLEMDPGAVDVNVHPQKVEVRFRDTSLVHSVVLRTVRDALRGADLTPALQGGAESPLPHGGFGGGRAILPGREWGGTGGSEGGPSSPAAGVDPAVRTAAFVEYFKRFAPAQTTPSLSYSALRDALTDGPSESGVMAGDAPVQSFAPSTAAPGTPAQAVGAVGGSPQESGDGTPDAQPARSPQPSLAGAIGLETPRPAERVLQIHNSFVVTQDEQGMVIVDQHALHERAMFEYLLARITGGGEDARGSLESQRLLVPDVLRVTPQQADRLPELRPLFGRLGIEVEPMGPDALGVHAFPTFLFDRGVEPGPFLAELFEKSDAEGFAPGSEATLHGVLDMMACKAAVKAGNRMTDLELRELLKLREAVERSSNCPHGRPTSIRLTIQELERRFGR